MSTFIHRSVCTLLATCSLITFAEAQTRIRTFDGTAAGDRLGLAVGDAGDVNDDGIRDLVLGAPDADGNGMDSGEVRVISGADWSVLTVLRGAAASDNFGRSAAGVGDVDGDGYDDILVGAPGESQGGLVYGAARAYSGVNWSLIHEFRATRAFVFYGRTVRAAGDMNGDGFDDLFVGVPPLLGTGSAFAFSGKDATLVRQALVTGSGDICDSAGDADGDGFDDLIVGRPGDELGGLAAGQTSVISSQTGAVLWSINGGPGAFLGSAVAGVGDVNSDGYDDVAVGAIELLNGGEGYVLVLSGLDGSLIRRHDGLQPGDQFGAAIAGGKDVDGDGRPDVLIGAPEQDANGGDSGAAFLFSGASGALLHQIAGDGAGDYFGSAVAIVGDLTGDGRSEYLVGAPDDDDNGANAGRAFVYDLGSTTGGTQGREREYGRACAGSNGNLPRMSVRGDTRLGASFSLHLRGALPNEVGYLILGGAVLIPLDFIGMPLCTLYVDPVGIAVPVATNPQGFSTLGFAIPIDPSLTGNGVDCQWFSRDAAANVTGFVTSTAAALIFGS